MKWIVPVVVIVLAVVGGVFTYQYYSTGQVTVYVKADPADPLFFTIDSVMIHGVNGSWITISNRTVTFQLTSNLTLLTSSRIPAGTYNEIRLYVTGATIEIGGSNFTVSVPSQVIKIPIVGSMKLKGGSSESILLTGNPHLIELGNGGFKVGPVFVAEVLNQSSLR
ncbi:hypothetical protein HS1genome_0716 [Sulfodiicoccus acidiphilus]|uniref:DUF4382 domain-containing protein n=1 Tax=Sulfodiicoccus acidiphilus TaxID=1670455 RepID=A0A348B2C5_9CREN|nr:DUF4382 domain-containing protein [Sulfodiicoccus acidiphilus]BBD72327.1 hypothetical protein HS1genome_0716 [Sulfodiicoccus acidiphilus]GGT90249.1 hypothetical protein GCM10007116_05050 [Sulfodiicoccus acidiphilus]